MPAPQIIRDLVERFEYNIEAYHSPGYNEAQLRKEFLDPFFEALGWDVANKKGYAVQYREVIHEDSIHIQGSSNAKAPDYAFRLGGMRKFFVEAKKPAEDIQNTKEFAYQLKIYAWSTGLPLSILTDFEEFAVYDCRVRPNLSDSPATSRIMFINYDEYLTRWDEIVDIFSPNAIRKGAFDKYAEDNTAKRGTTSVDEAFLGEIEEWRTLLARNIALRNHQVSNERQLNFAVQMTIDRIIFLRICEDRGIEPQNQIFELSQTQDIYQGLVALFTKADQKFNSGLFHFKAEKGNKNDVDSFTPSLIIDDKVLKDIIKSLYYPCPYVFKEIPVEILGQVYEQFLGKVIRLTPGHRAKVEEKPEVRKAGGVYYTPKYIVEYIVENTVGELLKGKTPDEAADFKIVDPACGSGSFLLGAFQYLMDWHEEYYLKHDPERWTQGSDPALIQTADGDWRLTTEEKKRILVNNLHGVDIDAQAVEVTKLSLLLKVLEEETGQLTLGFERALPNLSDNIKCGNSLIGWDYFEGQLIPNHEEIERINPFDFKKEFPEVFARGGFDAVIGNPPWGASLIKKEEEYFTQTYEIGKGSILDTYALFIEQAINILSRIGFLGFITPDTFLRKTKYFPLRDFILSNTSIRQLIECGPLFSQVRDTWCLVSIILQEFSQDSIIIHKKISRFITSVEDRLSMFGKKHWTSENEVLQSTWINKHDKIIGYLASEKAQKIIDKIELFPLLGYLTDIFYISRGEEGSKFNIKTDESGKYYMVIPENIEQYYVEEGVKVNQRTLKKTKKAKIYDHPKIWIIRIQKLRWKQRIVCSYDGRRNSCAMKTLQSITSKSDNDKLLKYLSAILSSKLINYWSINYLADDMNKSYLSMIPIRTIDNKNHHDAMIYGYMTNLVDTMYELHKRKPKTPFEQEQLEREITATDAQIDRYVYELYGLTDEEIKIIEKEG